MPAQSRDKFAEFLEMYHRQNSGGYVMSKREVYLTKSSLYFPCRCVQALYLDLLPNLSPSPTMITISRQELHGAPPGCNGADL
jgi:hypothetical protein